MSLHISGQERVSLPPSNLVIATDAGFVVQNRIHSGAFIGTDGSWGVEADAYKKDPCVGSCAAVTELRAIWYGIKRVLPEQAVTILADCQEACDFIEKWQQGDRSFPDNYDLRPRSFWHQEGIPTLVVLQQRVQSDPLITAQWVKGHAGHLLNEAADALAGIGINFFRGFYDKAEASRRAGSLVASFLISYHSEHS